MAKCDVCGEHVEADNANVIWMKEDVGEKYPGPYFVVCKRNSEGKPCDDIAETNIRKKSGKWTSWIQLDVAIMQLEHNVKLNRKQAKKSHKFISSIP